MWIVTAGDPVRRTSGHVRHAGRCCRGRDRIDDACADVQRDQPGTQGRPWPPDVAPHERTLRRDRKSVVSGKSVSVRVDLGGRGTIKKKTCKRTNNTKIYKHHIYK